MKKESMLLTLFSLPTNVFLEDLQIESDLLTLVLGSTLTQVPCPVCGQPSSRIHSRYTRRLSDLPCQGRAVRLQVQVRRFFCDAPTCSRKTFAEQFPLLAPAYARRTSRQAESLRTIASAAFRQSRNAPGEAARDANQSLHLSPPHSTDIHSIAQHTTRLGGG